MSDVIFPVISRLTASILLGYAFTAGSVALLSGVLTMLGISRVEATTLAAMLGFPLYLLLLLWSFSQPDLKHLWLSLTATTSIIWSLLWLML